MNREFLQEWLDKYVEAWRTYVPEKIGNLFSEDALYFYSPFDEQNPLRDARRLSLTGSESPIRLVRGKRIMCRSQSKEMSAWRKGARGISELMGPLNGSSTTFSSCTLTMLDAVHVLPSGLCSRAVHNCTRAVLDVL
jgi:hypothetical protein